jgi:hypothetical protein
VINYHLKVNLAIPQVTQTEYNKDQLIRVCLIYRTLLILTMEYSGNQLSGGAPPLTVIEHTDKCRDECWRGKS